jgi:hypothetical protein
MTRPYSEDLRERALARFEAGETIRSIGQALGISPVLRLEMASTEAGDRFAFAGSDRRPQAAGAAYSDALVRVQH